MSIFHCKNKKCINFNKEISINTLNWPYVLQSQRIEEMTCKECEEKMKSKPFIPKSNRLNNVATFSNKSSDEKKKILKKRANDHFRRNTDGMREYRDAMDRGEIT
jgi:hypothetical protein